MAESIENPRLGEDHPVCFTVTLHTVAKRRIGGQSKTHVVVNAMLKSVKLPVNGVLPLMHFSLDGARSPNVTYRQGDHVNITINFYQTTVSIIKQWLLSCSEYLQSNQRAGFQIHHLSLIKAYSLADLMLVSEQEASAQSAELFYTTPLPFKRVNTKSRTEITTSVFFKQLQKRAKQLLDIDLPLPDFSNVQLQYWYWHYTQIEHQSKSQAGHQQLFSGCCGSLYFMSGLRAVMPWLKLASIIGMGKKVQLNFAGHSLLYTPARPLFEQSLSSIDFWQNLADDMQEDDTEWQSRVLAETGKEQLKPAFFEGLIAGIQQQTLAPLPARHIEIQKRKGTRTIEVLSVQDSIVSTGLHELLKPHGNLIFEPSSHGFRAGYSVNTATKAVQDKINQGYQYVLESDIADFFPSVDIKQLGDMLAAFLPPNDRALRYLIKQMMQIPYWEGREVVNRAQGLPMGSPLSPFLANLYLDSFDEQMGAQEGAAFIRYADDFVILTRTEAQANALLNTVKDQLTKVGLAINEDKTAIKKIEDGFLFLGQQFNQHSTSTPAKATLPIKKTLYILEDNTYIGHKGDLLMIRKYQKPFDMVPMRTVSDIIILARATLGTGVIQKCSQLNIPVTLTLNSGYHVSTLTPDSRLYYEIAHAQGMHYNQMRMQDKLLIAKQFAIGKLNNLIPVINKRYHEGDHALIDALNDGISHIQQAQTVASVRGYEGAAAKQWFKAMNKRIRKPAFRIKKRDRLANDYMNNLLNFGYYLLFTRLNTLVRSAGLNPYLGYLHDGEDNYETLVCDIEELFRAHIDHMLIKTVNLGVIADNDFETRKEGLRLTRKGIKKILKQFETTMHQADDKLTVLQIMKLQIKNLVDYYTKSQPIWFYNRQVDTASQVNHQDAD